jgi:hypothetical protein
VHHLIRVISCRVSYRRDVVAQLGGIANGCFNGGVRDQSDDDEAMDAVPAVIVFSANAVCITPTLSQNRALHSQALMTGAVGTFFFCYCDCPSHFLI